jgi:hypothetical protein
VHTEGAGAKARLEGKFKHVALDNVVEMLQTYKHASQVPAQVHGYTVKWPKEQQVKDSNAGLHAFYRTMHRRHFSSLLFGHCYLAFVLALHAFVLLCGHLI